MSFLLFAFAHLMSQIKETMGVSTSEGMVFLISAPSTMVIHNSHKMYPRLVLSMESGVDSQVRITSEWMANPDLYVNISLDLKAFVCAHHFKNYLHYGPEFATGLRWTYHLVGTHPFAVLVRMETNDLTMETFTPLPVAGWGRRYFAVTLETQFSIVLISQSDDTKVNVFLRSAEPNFNLSILNTSFSNGSNVSLNLMRYQSFALGTCSAGDSRGSITGTSFESAKPFGMVNGHCLAWTYVKNCFFGSDEKYVGRTGDLVAEMFHPQETFGKYFIMFRIPEPLIIGFFVVIAGEDDTYVNFTGEHLNRTHLVKAGDWISQAAEYKWIECQKPCQVVYFQNSSCLIIGKPIYDADPSLLLVTPVELFFFIYVCMVPNVQMDHYLSLVTPLGKGVLYRTLPGQTGIITDYRNLPIKLPKSVKWGEWEFQMSLVERGSCFIIYSRAIRFGCFLFGDNSASSYLHSAGFISSNIQSCVRSNATANDLLDNDCDGLVDEEFLDNNDDDDDGRTDEDFQQTYQNFTMVEEYMQNHPSYTYDRTTMASPTGAPTRRISKVPTTKAAAAATPTTVTQHTTRRNSSGTARTTRGVAINTNITQTTTTTRTTQMPDDFEDYEEWTNWHCREDCQRPQLVRERPCKKEPVNNTRHRCTETHVETSDKICYVNETCPGNCPLYSYGVNCNSSCDHCDDPCNKFTGVCLSCKPGFMMAKNACNVACGYNSYGKECGGNCVEKCGQDCVERVDGDCPTSFIGSYFYVFIVLLLIPIVIFVYLSLQRAAIEEKEKVDEALVQERSISEMSRSQMSGGSGQEAKTGSSGGTLPPAEKSHSEKSHSTVTNSSAMT